MTWTVGQQLISRSLPPGEVRLPEGPRVVWQRTEVDCLQAAVATMFAVDYEQVPTGPGDEHTKVEELEHQERLHAWVRARGLRMCYRELGRPLLNRFWIGVSVDPRPGCNHTVVCLGRMIVFDPALAFPVPAGCEVEPVRELHYAITFDRIEAP